MKKVLGKIGIIVLLMGIMLFCGACTSKDETVPRLGISLENVENKNLPEVGWVTVL